MARSPITWRNVAGASAGNPGASIAGASNAFSSVARGSLDLVDSLRVGEDRANAEKTQRTIGNLLSSGAPLTPGAMPNFAEGVDTTQVLDSVLGAQNKQADLAYRKELTESEALNNDPETVKRKRAHEDRLASLQEKQLNIRNAELQATLNAAKTTEKIRTNATKLDTGWDQFVAAGVGPKEQAVQAELAAIENDPYLTPEEKATGRDALTQELQLYRSEWETENLGNYLSQARKEIPGISSEAINSSRAGQLQNQLTARATKLQEQRQEADLKYRDRQDAVHKAVMGGTKLNSYTLDENGTAIPLTDPGAAKNNILSKESMYELARAGASNWWGGSIDDDFPPQAKKRLDAIWETLDGNKAAITTLFKESGIQYNTDSIPFMAEDEVSNMPTTARAEEIAATIMAAASENYAANAKAGRPADAQGSQLQQTIASLTQARTQRAQQAAVQQFGGGGMFDQNVAGALQDYLNQQKTQTAGFPTQRLPQAIPPGQTSNR